MNPVLLDQQTLLTSMNNIANAFITVYKEHVIKAFLTGCDKDKYINELYELNPYLSKFKFNVSLTIYDTLSDVDKTYLIKGQKSFFIENNINIETLANQNISTIPIIMEMMHFEQNFERIIYLEKYYKYLYRFVAPKIRVPLEYRADGTIYSTVYIPLLLGHVKWLNDMTPYAYWNVEKKYFMSSINDICNKSLNRQYIRDVQNTGLIFTKLECEHMHNILKNATLLESIAFIRELTSKKKAIDTPIIYYQAAITK